MWLGDKPGRWVSKHFDIHRPTHRRRWSLDGEPLKVPTTFISGDEDGRWSLSQRWEPSLNMPLKSLFNLGLNKLEAAFACWKSTMEAQITRTTSWTSFWRLYCQLWADVAYCSGISIVDFEQVNAEWDYVLRKT